MSVSFNFKIGYNGNPNGLLDGPKNTLFYKSGSFYNINYSGSVANGWQPAYFIPIGLPQYFITEADMLLSQGQTGSFLYVKTTDEGSKTGWKLLSNVGPLIYNRS